MRQEHRIVRPRMSLPIVARGKVGERYEFTDTIGEHRSYAKEELATRQCQISLMRGAESPLRYAFPQFKKFSRPDGSMRTVAVDWDVAACGDYLREMAEAVGDSGTLPGVAYGNSTERAP